MSFTRTAKLSAAGLGLALGMSLAAVPTAQAAPTNTSVQTVTEASGSVIEGRRCYRRGGCERRYRVVRHTTYRTHGWGWGGPYFGLGGWGLLGGGCFLGGGLGLGLGLGIGFW